MRMSSPMGWPESGLWSGKKEYPNFPSSMLLEATKGNFYDGPATQRCKTRATYGAKTGETKQITRVELMETK